MLSILSLLVGVGVLAVLCSQRYPSLAAITKLIERGSDFAGRLGGNRNIGFAGVIMACASTVMVLLYPSRSAIWITILFVSLCAAGIVISDAILDWAERSLGRLVRVTQIKQYTQLTITFSALFVAALLVPRLSPAIDVIEQISSGFVFCFGVWLVFAAARLALLRTAPHDKEKLADFVIALLNTFLHHAIALAVLSWTFLGYLQKLAPGTFLGPDDSSAGRLLLMGYVLEKLTITGSGFVQPGSNLGYFLDVVFSILGYAMTVFGVASFFALLGHVKTDNG